MTKTNQSKGKLSTTKNSPQARQITLDDDLADIASQCNADDWGDDSELLTYSESSLREYLENSNNVLVGVLEDGRLAGVAIGYVLAHPSGNKTLYIDELDTHPDYRRRGIGVALMQKFYEIARQNGCSEVWLTTSQSNQISQALYRKLQPTEEKNAIVFGYEL